MPLRQEPCAHPECPSRARLYGRCWRHYQKLRSERPEEVVRLKAMSPALREREFYFLRHPLPPKWTYEGSEDELAAMVEAQDKTRTSED